MGQWDPMAQCLVRTFTFKSCLIVILVIINSYFHDKIIFHFSGPGDPQAQMNWQKMQQQFMHEKTKKGPNGPVGPHMMGPRGPMMGPGMMDPRMMGPGGRMPGPPPPYPQGPGPRGMPPGAMASPNPGSPATSLPMSSPAGGPMMNSPRPMGPGGSMGSNPGTPVSCAPLSSPVPGGPRNSPGIPPNPQGKINIYFLFFFRNV